MSHRNSYPDEMKESRLRDSPKIKTCDTCGARKENSCGLKGYPVSLKGTCEKWFKLEPGEQFIPPKKPDYHEELTTIHYVQIAADVLAAHKNRVESGLLINVIYAFKYLLRLGIKNDNPRQDVFKAMNHLHHGLYGKWLEGHDVDDSCNILNP